MPEIPPRSGLGNGNRRSAAGMPGGNTDGTIQWRYGRLSGLAAAKAAIRLARVAAVRSEREGVFSKAWLSVERRSAIRPGGGPFKLTS